MKLRECGQRLIIPKKSWYAQYFDTAENKALSIGGSVPAGQWAKLKISVSVPDKKYVICSARQTVKLYRLPNRIFKKRCGLRTYFN